MKRPIEKKTVNKIPTAQPFLPIIHQGKITHDIKEKITKARNSLVDPKETVLPQTNFLTVSKIQE